MIRNIWWRIFEESARDVPLVCFRQMSTRRFVHFWLNKPADFLFMEFTGGRMTRLRQKKSPPTRVWFRLFMQVSDQGRQLGQTKNFL